MRSIVKAVNLNKYYDQYHALQDINLEVEQGEVLCIIGPSGSGKSTLLRCVNQLEKIDKGGLWVDGELVGYRVVGNKLHELNESQIARQRLATGMVFQRFNLFPHMTVLQNIIEGPCQVLKRSPKEATEDALELLARVGLADKRNAYPVELSGGQQVTLEEGDILLMPGGATHLVRSQGARVKPVAQTVIEGGLLPIHRLGSDQPDVDMLCGSFRYNRQSLLFSALPDYLVVSSRQWQADGQLAALIALLRSEADGQQLGARFFIDALSSALFTLILRAWLTQQTPAVGTFALLADKRLGKAWQAMLAEPGHEWTIDSLAAAATMSRATFMRAFVKVAGVSPWVLLTRLRMELAFNLLRQSHLSLLDIAAQVGYQSQAAFSKKFKETYGEAPGRLRSSGG